LKKTAILSNFRKSFLLPFQGKFSYLGRQKTANLCNFVKIEKKLKLEKTPLFNGK
jgi:hypothetical protein